jgi:hypothetical protein
VVPDDDSEAFPYSQLEPEEEETIFLFSTAPTSSAVTSVHGSGDRAGLVALDALAGASPGEEAEAASAEVFREQKQSTADTQRAAAASETLLVTVTTASLTEAGID